jgi:alanine dehydrogenase
MQTIKIGLIREDKIPVDRRVAFLPEQLNNVLAVYPKAEFFIQKSPVRAVHDNVYEDHGFTVVDSVEHCDILFGIKEVPPANLIEGKTYFFFSHTIKQQPYNQKLIRTALAKKITLIDYECLVDEKGARVVAFGQYAGLVGAYNGVRAWGIRNKSFELKPAFECEHVAKLKKELPKVTFPANTKILITGTGRVAKGAKEILDWLDMREVSAEAYRTQTFNTPVFAMLRSADYHQHKDGNAWDSNHWHNNPEEYVSTFEQYIGVTDMLIACAYWNPKAPVLFTKERMQAPGFNISVIADVTCDIDGSIPTTLRPTTITEPYYDYNPATFSEVEAFSSDQHITIMAVDNLPCELPTDASCDFGEQLEASVLPALLGTADKAILERATITKNGKLGAHFQYLAEYAGVTPITAEVE